MDATAQATAQAQATAERLRPRAPAHQHRPARVAPPPYLEFPSSAVSMSQAGVSASTPPRPRRASATGDSLAVQAGVLCVLVAPPYRETRSRQPDAEKGRVGPARPLCERSKAANNKRQRKAQASRQGTYRAHFIISSPGEGSWRPADARRSCQTSG